MHAECPLCRAEVVKPEGEAMHRCPNRACPSRGLETLNNWVMAAADIDGVGEKTVWQLWEAGLVDLDAPAQGYLRSVSLVPADRGVRPPTLRHLLTHTAGVRAVRGASDLLRPDLGWSARAGRR